MLPRRILITGADGFVGRQVLRAMVTAGSSPSWAIVPWDRMADGDLLDPDAARGAVARHQPDAFLHLAWLQTGVAGYERDPANQEWAEAALQVIEVCAATGTWFLGTGTGLETDVGAEATPYLEAKQRIRRRLETSPSTLAWTWLRPRWIVSRSERRPRVLRAALEAADRGEVFAPSNPGVCLDFIDVHDVATAIVRVLEADLRGVQDIGSGRLRTVASLLRAAGCQTSGPFAEADAPPSPSLEALRSAGWSATATACLFDEVKGTSIER